VQANSYFLPILGIIVNEFYQLLDTKIISTGNQQLTVKAGSHYAYYKKLHY